MIPCDSQALEQKGIYERDYITCQRDVWGDQVDHRYHVTTPRLANRISQVLLRGRK